MLWLSILLAVLLLLVLLCMMRVGIWTAFDGNGLRLDVKIGPVRVHILPAKPKKPKAERPKAKPKKPQKPPARKPERPKLSITLEDIRDALRTMLPPLKRALSRTRRGIRFQPLRLSLTLGGQEDPASSAQLYGSLQAAVWGGMPVLEKLADIPDPYIHTGVDFEAASPAVEGEVGVTFRVGTLIALGFGLTVPALKWFLRFRRRAKSRLAAPEEKKEASSKAPGEPAA